MEKSTSEPLRPGGTAACVYEQAFTQQVLGESLHPGGLALTRHALALCDLPATARVLDMGCGAGLTVQYLRELGYTAWGMDISSLLVHAGSQRAPTLPLFQADADCLPLPAQALDVVVAECSLSVFENAGRILEECRRLLRTDGILILSDLYARNPTALPTLRSLLPASCLARSFIKDDLLALLAECGFSCQTWEDHSEAVKSLASQALSTTLLGAPAHGSDPLDLALAVARAKPGYFLCVSQKC